MPELDTARQSCGLVAVFAAFSIAPNFTWALVIDGKNFSDDEIFTAVTQKFKKVLSHRFNPADTSDRKPLLLLGPKLEFGAKVQSSSFVHLTQQELIAEQQAVFLWVTKAHPDLERKALYVHYELPSNASFGVLKVYPREGALVVDSHESFRSSSGARHTYAKLYSRVRCVNDTEMAYRWNFYERQSGGTCREPTFTEFDDYVRPPR